MAVKSSGELSFHNDIAVEFRDDPDHALSEFYGDSPPLPLAGEIAFSDFYGTIRNFDVQYQIVGGGGAGGWGLDDGYSSTSNNPGGDSVILINGVEAVRATGGVGGRNAYSGANNYRGEDGESSIYGPGGLGGGGDAVGQDAPATSYGAGGGGGGGDWPSRYDSSGGAGGGGGSSLALTSLFRGALSVPAGSRVDVVIGAGGTNSGGSHAGGSGASGYAELTVNGGTTTSFTQSGFIILPGV